MSAVLKVAPLERAIGFHTEAEAAAIKADLERIQRDLAKLLQSEFVEETALWGKVIRDTGVKAQ